MTIFGIVVASYLIAGIIFLIIFQLTTHRITQRLHDVSVDVMMKLAGTGAMAVTRKMAVGITLIYAWVAWVAVLIAFINDVRSEGAEKK